MSVIAYPYPGRLRGWLARLARAGAVVGVGSAIAAGAYVGSAYLTNSFPFGPPPVAGAANVWVNTSAGSCTRSSTQVAYSSTTACGSYDAAWDVALAGDLIRVKNGSYGAQNVTGNKTSETKIVGESKSGVTISGATAACFPPSNPSNDSMMCAMANHMTIENMTINAGTNTNGGGAALGSQICAENVTYNNVDILGYFPDISIGLDYPGYCPGRGAFFHWNGGVDGSPGMPARLCSASSGWDAGEPIWSHGITNMTIEGVTFNTQTVSYAGVCADPNNSHLEFIRIDQGSDDFTLRNSVFKPGSDAGSGYIFGNGVGGTNRGVIVGNYFADNNGGTWIQAGGAECDWTIAYNTFSGDDGPSMNCTAFPWVGNVGPASSYPGCAGTHTKNVWGGTGSCGTDTFTTGSLGVDATGHLTAGSIAIDAGETPGASDLCTDPAYLNSRDIDGDVRPNGSVCDAGADER